MFPVMGRRAPLACPLLYACCRLLLGRLRAEPGQKKPDAVARPHRPVFRALLACLCLSATAVAEEFRRLSVQEYVDKMKAGWIGQMTGVGWGYRTEFKFCGKIIPPEKVPRWRPKMVNNALRQDDPYVEMTFLRTLEMHGLHSSIRQAGIGFANSEYRLWWEDEGCRKNLRRGLAPPDCSHPKFNGHADGIGYQTQSDFSGLISPGLPVRVIAMGEVFGRLTDYGDGIYAGQFMGGMYAEAFFETDIAEIVKAGLRCIPEGSRYHECIGDVLQWYEQDPTNWERTRQHQPTLHRLFLLGANGPGIIRLAGMQSIAEVGASD